MAQSPTRVSIDLHAGVDIQDVVDTQMLIQVEDTFADQIGAEVFVGHMENVESGGNSEKFNVVVVQKPVRGSKTNVYS